MTIAERARIATDDSGILSLRMFVALEGALVIPREETGLSRNIHYVNIMKLSAAMEEVDQGVWQGPLEHWECDVCQEMKPRDELHDTVAYGIETTACDDCFNEGK